jgi:hypothetical protein
MRRPSLAPAVRPTLERDRRGLPRGRCLHRRRVAAIVLVVFTALALSACSAPATADVAIVGLEDTTYVNGTLTFDVAVVGAPADSLELRRDGELFQVLTDGTYTWDTTAAPEGSYVFVARARRGGAVLDSAPKTVVVDRTAPTVTMTVDAPDAPIVLPAGSITLSADAEDAHGVPRVEFLDGDGVVGTVDAAPYAVTLPAVRGLHAYRARVVDRAGNVAQTAAVDVPVYVRETLTLVSEAALDGCVVAGYEPSLYERRFDVASCTYATSYPILHFFSFDRSPWPGAVVEEASLRFALLDATPGVYLASVAYDAAADAPPTAFVWPFVPEVPESYYALASTGTGPSAERLDVSNLVQADVADGRPRSQFRLRHQAGGPSGLGGLAYFAEIGDARVPTLVVTALVP